MHAHDMLHQHAIMSDLLWSLKSGILLIVSDIVMAFFYLHSYLT